MLSSGLMPPLLFGAEAAERRKALTQFSRLVAPEVMEEILARGKKSIRACAASVLQFCSNLGELRFYSEQHEPEDVVDLNACTPPSCRRTAARCRRHHGDVTGARVLDAAHRRRTARIDKHIGDAIMARFSRAGAAPIMLPMRCIG